MALYSRKYSATSAREILCLYKCERCGEFNLAGIKLVGRGSYDDRNLGFRKGTFQERREEGERYASSNAENSLGITIGKLEGDLSAMTLARTGIRSQCKRCGREPWWTLKIPRFLYAAAKVLSILGFALLVWTKDWHVPFEYAALVLTAAGVCWIAYFIYLGFAQIRLKKGIKPLFAGSIEKMREKKNRNIVYKDAVV